MKIRISSLDALFSRFIRLRDGRCVCCADPASPHKRDPKERCGAYRETVLHAAHIFGRGQKSTRFHADNAVAFGFRCHAWQDAHASEKWDWQAQRLGLARWNDLRRQAATPGKPDQALILLWLRQELQRLETVR